jgi:hypothetical protein
MGLIDGVQHVFVIPFGNEELVKIPDSYMVRYALREVGAEVDLYSSGNKKGRERRGIAVRED